MKKIKTLILVIVVLGCATTVYSSGFFSDSMVGQVKLKVPVIADKIDKIEVNEVYNFDFKTIYSGDYFFSIRFEHSDYIKQNKQEWYSANFNIPVEVLTEYYNEDKLVFSKKINTVLKKGDMGMDTYVVNFPKDIPLKKNLVCKIKFTKLEEEFYDYYSTATVLMKKTTSGILD